MKLQLKLAIYNALSKAVIILAFGALLPKLVEKVVYNHIDQRLIARTAKVLKIIQRGGLNDIVRESDCTFESYNILKEEFIVINPLSSSRHVKPTEIVNEECSIEGENLNHRIIRQSFVYDNQLYELTIGEGVSAVEQLNLFDSLEKSQSYLEELKKLYDWKDDNELTVRIFQLNQKRFA